MSDPHTPMRRTRTRTSSGPGTGTGASSNSITPGCVIVARIIGSNRFSHNSPMYTARSGKMLKKAAALIGLLLLGYLLYQPRPSKELTIGTVNNADMILMQRLSGEFERESGIKLNWVVLGESILRQRLTVDISTGGSTFDIITIGSYEAPLWAARDWLVPLDDLGADYDYEDIFAVIRQG